MVLSLQLMHVSKISVVVCIVQSERVENAMLYEYELYCVQRALMAATSGSKATVERLLWHSTDVGTAVKIRLHGFNRAYGGKNL